MNAHALLTSQGWRGTGHSLHKSDDSIGLAKPILASRKNNTMGIGRKSHVTSDQWWLNAFDEQLKALDTSSKTSVVQTKKHTQLEMIAAGTGKYTGANALYACFVRGGMLDGTVDGLTETKTADTTPEAEVMVPVRKETKEERRMRREEKRRRKAEKLVMKAQMAANAEKARVKEAKKAKKAASTVASDLSKSSVKQKSKGKKGDVPWTKEERRARKQAKRAKQAGKEERRKAIEEG